MDVLRLCFVAMVVLPPSGYKVNGASLAPIAIAVSSTAPAFDEAVAAFRTAMGSDSGQIILIPNDRNDQTHPSTGALRPRLGVAFGSSATEAFSGHDPAIPLVVTMVLNVDAGAPPKLRQLISVVSLSINPALILSKLRSTFPDRKRLAVLLGPNSAALRSELPAMAMRLGYVLEIVDCSGPRDVIAAFAALRGRVDFVWCLPDGSLFPSAAIPPILLASIRNQLPVIGFSEGFVRAGAAVGFFPDYADVGIQTAETVKRLLSKQDTPGVDTPRKLRMAVNDRVLRILGIERGKFSPEVLIIR